MIPHPCRPLVGGARDALLIDSKLFEALFRQSACRKVGRAKRWAGIHTETRRGL